MSRNNNDRAIGRWQTLLMAIVGFPLGPQATTSDPFLCKGMLRHVGSHLPIPSQRAKRTIGSSDTLITADPSARTLPIPANSSK